MESGTAIARIGGSSVALVQSLFQHGANVATAESVVVQVDDSTHRSTPLDQAVKTRLVRWLMPKPNPL